MQEGVRRKREYMTQRYPMHHVRILRGVKVVVTVEEG